MQTPSLAGGFQPHCLATILFTTGVGVKGGGGRDDVPDLWQRQEQSPARPDRASPASFSEKEKFLWNNYLPFGSMGIETCGRATRMGKIDDPSLTALVANRRAAGLTRPWMNFLILFFVHWAALVNPWKGK